MRHWRAIIVHAPLPMLALAASYGVYQFNALFMPPLFAFVAAAAFELTYLGLAFVRTPDRSRARNIALGAVVVSVLYNTLAGLFHRQPGWLLGVPWYGELALAILHGLPLAVVAYNVSMLLHGNAQAPDASEQATYSAEQITITVGRHTFTAREWSVIAERPVSTLMDRAARYRAALEQPAEEPVQAPDRATDADRPPTAV